MRSWLGTWCVWVLAALLATSAAAVSPTDPVDLNTAPMERLLELPGIGPKKAEAILELRKKRPFTRLTQLLEVRGIGRKTLERLRPLVRIVPAPARASPRPAPGT